MLEMLSNSSPKPNSTIASSGSTGTLDTKKTGKKGEELEDSREGMTSGPSRTLKDRERSQPIVRTVTDRDMIDSNGPSERGQEKETTMVNVTETTEEEIVRRKDLGLVSRKGLGFVRNRERRRKAIDGRCDKNRYNQGVNSELLYYIRGVLQTKVRVPR
jgi:hypothetical protein